MKREVQIQSRRLLREKRSARVLLAGIIVLLAGIATVYLYFHNPHQYPLPCIFYLMTGFYCPGCGTGRACYSILHGQFLKAFCYNPVTVVLLPFIGLYIAARAIDWIWTGGNHVDCRINEKMLIAVLVFVLLFGVMRNLPFYPFSLLVPGGLQELLM
nr:DUF2752 domain-containing protein [uncultured Mediterraneibacter sp.]